MERTRTDDHRCPAPGCEKRIPDAVLACRQHWFALPRAIRGRINRWYFIGQTAATMRPEYAAALEEAQAYWRGDHETDPRNFDHDAAYERRMEGR